jgi:hypothetical protein
MALMDKKNYWKQHETTKMIQVRKHPTMQKSSSSCESSHMGKNSIGFIIIPGDADQSRTTTQTNG